MYLLDATPLQSEHRLRGVGTYVRYLSAAFVRQYPERVRFVLATNGIEHVAHDVVARSVRAPRFHKPAQVYWMYNELFLRQALIRTRPRVFHSTDFNGLVTVPGSVTVATLHDVMGLKFGSGGASLSARLSHWRWNVYYRKLHEAQAIITVSDAVKSDAIKYLGLAAERITTIHPGVDVSRFRPRLPLPSDFRLGTFFLCVGACQPHKNYDRILRAFSQIATKYRDVSLVIAGEWHSEQLRWLAETTEKLGIKKQVRHVGYVALEVLPALYANAVAFVFPSLDEGFGSPLVESMASGTPFITTNHGALKEVAGSSGILVDPCDPGSIAHAMDMLMSHPRLRDSLGQSGLRRSLLFSWDRVATNTAAVYESVLPHSFLPHER